MNPLQFFRASSTWLTWQDHLGIQNWIKNPLVRALREQACNESIAERLTVASGVVNKALQWPLTAPMTRVPSLNLSIETNCMRHYIAHCFL